MSLGEEKDTRLGEEVMILPLASWNSKAPVSGFTEMPPKAVRMPTNPLLVVRVNEGRIFDLDSGATIGVSICCGLFFAAEIRHDPGAATANSRLRPLLSFTTIPAGLAFVSAANATWKKQKT